MPNTQALIAQAYSAFNHRDVDSALALMSETVSWPKASEGGRVVGKEEIRAYWTRQWKEFDPHVDPLEILEQKNGTTDVNGLIERMDIKETEASAGPSPSKAFSRR